MKQKKLLQIHPLEINAYCVSVLHSWLLLNTRRLFRVWAQTLRLCIVLRKKSQFLSEKYGPFFSIFLQDIDSVPIKCVTILTLHVFFCFFVFFSVNVPRYAELCMLIGGRIAMWIFFVMNWEVTKKGQFILKGRPNLRLKYLHLLNYNNFKKILGILVIIVAIRTST